MWLLSANYGTILNNCQQILENKLCCFQSIMKNMRLTSARIISDIRIRKKLYDKNISNNKTINVL